MSEIFNEQRILGIQLVADGTTMHNGQRVIGIREGDAGILFSANRRRLKVEVVADGVLMHNDQRVVGAVLISDSRQIYNGMVVVPSTGAGYDPVIALGAKVLEDWSADSGVEVVGGYAASWTGRKAGRVMSQAIGGYRPAYNATGFNGRPALIPDGIDDYLEGASQWDFPIGSAGAEIWVLVDQTGPADGSARHMFGYGPANAAVNRRTIVAPVVAVNRCRVAVGNGTATINTTNTVVDFSGIHLARAIIEPTQIRMRVDGLADPSPTAGVPATEAGLTRMFSSLGSVVQQFGIGRYNRMIVTSLLSDAEATPLREYLLGLGGLS